MKRLVQRLVPRTSSVYTCLSNAVSDYNCCPFFVATDVVDDERVLYLAEECHFRSILCKLDFISFHLSMTEGTESNWRFYDRIGEYFSVGMRHYFF